VKALAALAVAAAGAVGAFAGYTLGSDEEKAKPRQQPTAPRTFTLEQGDLARMPSAATECLATHEATIPRLFCTRIRASRYQVIINRDVVHVYDLEHPDVEPFEPTYSVPASTGG
jgi:hypothetical protein